MGRKAAQIRVTVFGRVENENQQHRKGVLFAMVLLFGKKRRIGTPPKTEDA